MSSIIVGVANQKGEVGKTTSTVNLARALIELGKRVLVVDCDPQSSIGIAHLTLPPSLRFNRVIELSTLNGVDTHFEKQLLLLRDLFN